MGAGNYQYIYTFEYDGKQYRYHRRLAPEKKGNCYDFGEILYAVNCTEEQNNSCILSRVMCAEDLVKNMPESTDNGNTNKCFAPVSKRSFYPAETISPVMIYFKKYNNTAINYPSVGTNYNGENYKKYFYSPTYGVKNRIQAHMSEYENRFSYGLYQTGTSATDNKKYPGNKRRNRYKRYKS